MMRMGMNENFNDHVHHVFCNFYHYSNPMTSRREWPRSWRSVKQNLKENKEEKMTEAYIIDAARTPRGIGKLGKGSLSEFHPGRLLATVLEEIQKETTS